MSSYTLGEIRSDIKLALSPESGNTVMTDSQINRRINDALKDIVMRLELPEFEESDTSLSLSTSTREYSLSSFSPTVLLVLTVKDTVNDQVLQPFTRDQAEKYDEAEEGEPYAYFRYGSSIKVYPLPSSSYNGNTLRVLYLGEPTTLSSDSDTPETPDYLDQAIRELSTGHCFFSLNEVELASQHYALYEGMLRSYKSIRARELAHHHRTLFPLRRF